MGIWQVATQRARAAAHVSAAGLTLLFALPIGGYLVYQHYGRSQELNIRAMRHAEIYSRRIEQVLGQAGIAATAEPTDMPRSSTAPRTIRWTPTDCACRRPCSPGCWTM